MYFKLISIESHKKSLEKISVAVQSISTIFEMAEEILDIERQSLVVLLFDEGTIIDNNEYLQSLNENTELFICSKEQHEKLSVYLLFKMFQAASN